MEENILTLHNVSKRFTTNGVLACAGIDLNLLRGETVVLMGENGAGKSTLLSLIEGSLSADEGFVEYRGRGKPGIIHQRCRIPFGLSVGESILSGNTNMTGRVLIKRKDTFRRINKLLKELNCSFRAETSMENLNSYQFQLVELAEQILLGNELILLDEPDFPDLLNIKHLLVSMGHTLVMVTHHIGEALKWGERIILMGQGIIKYDRSVGDHTRKDLNEILGASKCEAYPKTINPNSGYVEVWLGHRDGGLFREELTLLRTNQDERGGYLPSEAKVAMEGSWTVCDNLLVHERKELSGPFGFINRKTWQRRGSELFEQFKVKGYLNEPLSHLSGGNQRKLLIKRELNRNVDTVLLVQPSQALDVKNQQELIADVLAARNKGKKIVIMTDDPYIALSCADSILIHSKGAEVQTINPNEASEAKLTSIIHGGGD